MTDQEYADAIKAAIISLRKIVRDAKNAGLDVKVTSDSANITSGARVARNFFSDVEDRK